MVNVKTVSDYIDKLAPYSTQCSWDNSGILVGDETAEVSRVGVCLDLTDETLASALSEGVDLIVTHHPLIFTPQKNFLSDDKAYKLAKHGIHLISVHTPFDCAQGGINDVLCDILGIVNAVGIEDSSCPLPMARIGEVKEQSSSDFAHLVAEKLNTACRVVDCKNTIKKVAVCGGTGFDFFFEAVKMGADAYVTGEIKHHEMLLAKENGITVIDAGHFHTENPAMAVLKNKLENEFEDVDFVLLEQSAPCKFIGR